MKQFINNLIICIFYILFDILFCFLYIPKPLPKMLYILLGILFLLSLIILTKRKNDDCIEVAMKRKSIVIASLLDIVFNFLIVIIYLLINILVLKQSFLWIGILIIISYFLGANIFFPSIAFRIIKMSITNSRQMIFRNIICLSLCSIVFFFKKNIIISCLAGMILSIDLLVLFFKGQSIIDSLLKINYIQKVSHK